MPNELSETIVLIGAALAVVVLMLVGILMATRAGDPPRHPRGRRQH